MCAWMASASPVSRWVARLRTGRRPTQFFGTIRGTPQWEDYVSHADEGLARIIRKGSDFGSQDGVIVSRTKDRTLPLSSAGHVGRKIGRMARCERPAGQLRRGRSREAR